MNFWGASLNSLPLPSLDHPWLGTLARQIYTGTPFEQGLANLGLLAAVLALAGFWAARRNREWRPVQVLAAAAVVLALGLTVKWNNETVMWTWLKPVTTALWGLGHLVKPAFFTGTNPPQPFDGAVPAPGMLLAMFVPFIENARVFARFALVGSIGVSMLAGLALSLVKHRWLQLGLILLLLFEVVPQPLAAQPFTGISHPAFEWLSQQDLAGGSVADIAAGHPYTPVLYVEGESAWATRLHGKPTVGGASSVWPLHTAFLNNWLASHEHAFWDPKLAPILRYYNIRYLLIYLRGDWERGLLAEARQNDQLRFVDCFDPPAAGGPWPYPICALQVLPPIGEQKVNLVLEDGWSGQEDWGVWAEGARSTAFWVAMAKGAASLDFKVFPNCLPDQRQKMAVSINGTVVATYDWQACEEHTAHVDLPASLVRQGKNELVLETTYATPPTGNQNETRNLSVGFTQLQVTPH